MNKTPIIILLLFLSSGASAQLAIGTLNRVTKSVKGGVYNFDSLYFQTVDGTYPGLMTVQQKLNYDSLYNGLKFDTTYLIGQGAGTPTIRSSGDSIYFNTLVPGTGITFTHNSDSSISITSSGYNVVIPYGNGNAGIPIKGGDSIYVNTNLIGKHVIVYATNNTTTTRLADSIEWIMTGSNGSTPYIRFNTALGEVIFCNFSNDSSIKNGATALSIFGGTQGSYANVDNGTPLTPMIAVSPTSITGMTDTAGSVGKPKMFTASGTNLTSNITVTAPANFSVSLNDATFTGSITLTESGGTVFSTPVYVQIANTAPAGSVSGNVACTSSGATTQDVAVSGTVSPGSARDSINVKFDTLISEEITGGGWVSMRGNIQTALGDSIGVTGGIHNSIRITANLTGGGNTLWGLTYPNPSTTNPGGGVTASSVFAGAPTAMNNCWINSNIEYQYSPQPQIQIAGLLPGHTYTIQVSGSINATTMALVAPAMDSANTWYYAGSSLTMIYGPEVVSAYNPATSTPNTIASYTFTVTADTNGKDYIWVGQYQDGGIGVISAFKLKQTD
jgi:hypothetical protein